MNKMKKVMSFFALVILGFIGRGSPKGSVAQSINEPILKWAYGGCYSSWCETGWYSSPVVADLNGDGHMDIVSSAYSIISVDGETGVLQWRVKSGYDRSVDPNSVDNVGRTWAGIVLADIDNDGNIEIITAHSGGTVSVYDKEGYFKPGWPQHLAENEFRSLAVDDLDGDNKMEIIVGLARLNQINVWVLEPNGVIRTGWPQLNSEEGSAAGIYNDNIGIGDMDNDGDKEVVIPSDTITVCAYDDDGTQLKTNSVYHDHAGHDMDKWGEVPAYVEIEYEQRGWGPCYTEPTARANFSNGPANIVDVNHDGIVETVVIGNVHDCHTSPYTDLFYTPYIFNLDRTRFVANPFDWTEPPLNTGAPLSEDYNLIESVQPNPVTVDLDGDGNLEILFPSYDGRLHAVWLDKTEHGNWPFSVYNPGEGFYRFASEPVVADLNSDGFPEVIFSSWTQKGSGKTGYLHILDYQGNQIYQVPIPEPKGSWNWNGALAAPTLANIDNDPDLEILLNTAHAGLVAYDLPGTAGARILWGTGRGSYQRLGAVLSGNLELSRKQVNNPVPSPGETLTYKIVLENNGPKLGYVSITDTLPSELVFSGNLSATSGSVSQSNGIVMWNGEVPPALPVVIQFDATIPDEISVPYNIVNEVLIDDHTNGVIHRQSRIIVGGYAVYLPVNVRSVSH